MVKKAFTLIETMISLGVISIVIPVIFSLLFISLRAELKIKALKEVKNNGDFALAYISENVRENAYKPVNCDSSGSEITTNRNVTSVCFKTTDNKCFEILVDSNVLKLRNADCGDAFLTPASEAVLTNSKSVNVSDVHFGIVVPKAENTTFDTSSVSISFRVASIIDPTTYLYYYSRAKIRDY